MSVFRVCEYSLLWWKKNWGKITHKNWLLRQNFTQEYFTIIKSPMQMHSFLKSSCFPGVWKRKPFSPCLLQHTKAHFGWVQGRRNAYHSCRFCFYFHKYIYLFCLSTHHLSTFLKANQFGLIWKWIASLSSTMPLNPSLHLGSQNHELSLSPFELFFSFGCEPIDFPSKMVPCACSLDLLLFFGGLGLSSKFHGSNLCSSQPIGLLHFIGS